MTFRNHVAGMHLSLILLSCLWSVSSASAASNRSQSVYQMSIAEFCVAYSPLRKCPTVPSITALDVKAYTGLWYEIGATAGIKFAIEAGVKCVTANYTLDGSGPYIPTPFVIPDGPPPSSLASPTSAPPPPPPTPESQSPFARAPTTIRGRPDAQALSFIPRSIGNGSAVRVVNRADNVTAPAVLEAAFRINSLTRVISSTLATTCPLVSSESGPASESVDRIKSAVATVGSANDDIIKNAHKIPRSVSRIREAAKEIPDSLTSLAIANADIVQGSYDRTIKRQFVTSYIKIAAAARKMRESAIDVKRDASRIRKLASRPLTSATNTIVVESEKLHSLAVSSINAANQIMHSAREIAREHRFISNLESILRPDAPVYTGIVGRAVQSPTDPGKLTVGFSFFPGMYWIIAIEGSPADGYEAALIYSCQDFPPSFFNQVIPRDGDGGEGIFLIARRPAIPNATVDRLLGIAKAYGINLGATNPFIRTSYENCSGRTLTPAA